MGQPSDLLASAPVGLCRSLRDGLCVHTSLVVAGSSEIPLGSRRRGADEPTLSVWLNKGRRSSDHQRAHPCREYERTIPSGMGLSPLSS
jgi:hypothetical protein